jgi:hypothetical protein
VHSILHLQADWTNTQHDTALKQGLREASLGCLLAHDYRSELAVVTYEDTLTSAENQGYHGFGLGGLHR